LGKGTRSADIGEAERTRINERAADARAMQAQQVLLLGNPSSNTASGSEGSPGVGKAEGPQARKELADIKDLSKEPWPWALPEKSYRVEVVIQIAQGDAARGLEERKVKAVTSLKVDSRGN